MTGKGCIIVLLLLAYMGAQLGLLFHHFKYAKPRDDHNLIGYLLSCIAGPLVPSLLDLARERR